MKHLISGKYIPVVESLFLGFKIGNWIKKEIIQPAISEAKKELEQEKFLKGKETK